MSPGGASSSSSRRSSGRPVGATDPSAEVWAGSSRVVRPPLDGPAPRRSTPPASPMRSTAPVWAKYGVGARGWGDERERRRVRRPGRVRPVGIRRAARTDVHRSHGSLVDDVVPHHGSDGHGSDGHGSDDHGSDGHGSGRRRRPGRPPGRPRRRALGRGHGPRVRHPARGAAHRRRLALQRADPGHPAAPGPREPLRRAGGATAFGPMPSYPATAPQTREAPVGTYDGPGGYGGQGAAGGAGGLRRPRAGPADRSGWLRLGRHGRRARHPARRPPPRPGRRLGRRRGPRGRRTDPAAAAARDPRAGRPGAGRGPHRRRPVGRRASAGSAARRAPRRAPRSTSPCRTRGPPTRSPGRSRRWRRTCCPAPCRSAARPARARGSCSRPTA